MRKKVIIILVSFLVLASVHAQKKGVYVRTGTVSITSPIDTNTVTKAIKLINDVYNSTEFRIELEKYNFVCTNRPSLCDSSGVISGSSVYKDFAKYDTLTINLIIKRVGIKFWKRYFSATLGETDPNDNTIITYTWWLDDDDVKQLIIEYATHIGHEIFHTKYYKYIHDPAYGTKNFVNDKDVTYKIDDIIEELVKKNYR